MSSRSPINILFDRVDWKCAICGAKAGTCGCWTKCGCGWSYETKGGHCRNPVHGTITIRCPTCGPGTEKPVGRDPDDPPEAATVEIPCKRHWPKGAKAVPIRWLDASGGELLPVKSPNTIRPPA